MLQQIGARTYTTIQFPDESPEIVMPFNTLEIFQERNIVMPKYMIHGRNANRPIRDSLIHDGNAILPVDTESFCYYLYALLGDYKDITTPEDTKYRYLFYMGDDIIPFDLNKYFVDLKRKETFTECTVDDLNIMFGGDEDELLTTGNLRAVRASTSAFSTNPSVYTPECKTLNPQLFTAVINGEILNSIYVGEIVFNNNSVYQEYPIAKQNQPSEASTGVVQCAGYFMTLFDNVDQYLELMSKDTVSIEIIFRRDNKKDGDYVKFIFPEAIIKIDSAVLQSQEGLVIDLEWIAFYEHGDIESTMLVEVKTDRKFLIEKEEP